MKKLTKVVVVDSDETYIKKICDELGIPMFAIDAPENRSLKSNLRRAFDTRHSKEMREEEKELLVKAIKKLGLTDEHE